MGELFPYSALEYLKTGNSFLVFLFPLSHVLSEQMISSKHPRRSGSIQLPTFHWPKALCPVPQFDHYLSEENLRTTVSDV